MNELFFEILNMSISAGWVVLFLLLPRPLLTKAPGWIRMALWGAVVLRLRCLHTARSYLIQRKYLHHVRIHFRFRFYPDPRHMGSAHKQETVISCLR